MGYGPTNLVAINGNCNPFLAFVAEKQRPGLRAGALLFPVCLPPYGSGALKPLAGSLNGLAPAAPSAFMRNQ